MQPSDKSFSESIDPAEQQYEARERDEPERAKAQRRKALESMVTEAEQLGLYSATDRRLNTR